MSDVEGYEEELVEGAEDKEGGLIVVEEREGEGERSGGMCQENEG